MGVSITSAEAERKFRRVARLLGKSLTATAIELADRTLKEIDAIVRRFNSRPLRTDKSVNEILGDNDKGPYG